MTKRLAIVAALTLFTTDAFAFSHVVSQGETLAQLAIKVYGTPRFEVAIAGANALDVHGGSAIVPGQMIEIPAPSHHRVAEGETWFQLSRVYLGDPQRAATLARANGGVPWVLPVPNQEIEIPAVVGHIVAENETMLTLAQRYYGDPNKEWELHLYNARKPEQRLNRGDIVLVPLLDLSLTEEGKKAARVSAERVRTEGGGQAYEAQRHAESEIPPLYADLRGGRYVEVVAKGNKLLGSGELTKPQLGSIWRALLEAYVALDAHGQAAAACALWKTNVGTEAKLDPRLTSPKIRAACGVDPTPRPRASSSGR